MLILLFAYACVINKNNYLDLRDEIATEDRDDDGYADATESGDDCDDLDPAIHPDAEETWSNGVTDNDCDGDREPVEVEFGATALVGESAGANAGRRLATVGDINGDGRDELLVGAYTDSSETVDGGAAYLVMGTAAGSLGRSPALRPSGDEWYLGSAVDGGPDVDGDGVPDVVVGALGWESYTGAAWLVSGADLGKGSLLLPEDAIGSVVGSEVGDVAGASARFLGDVTGDGVDELAISAQSATAGEFAAAGLVGIWSVDELGDAVIDDASIVVYGTYANAYIGSEVKNAGDQDGDGLDDYLISSDSGLLAAILPGGLDAPALEGDALFRLTAATEVPESAEVRMIGDVDGDGTPDLAAIPLRVGDEEIAPQVLIYTALAATPTRTDLDPSATIDIGAGSYAYDVANAGDLDGDGRAETLVPAQDYAGLDTSAFTLHFGDTLSFHASVDFLDSPLLGVSVRPTAKLGYRALVASDLDGDGVGDIVLGGYADDEGGEDAGAVTLLGLPQ